MSWHHLPSQLPCRSVTTEQHGVRGNLACCLLFLLHHTWRAFGNLGPQNMVFFFLPGQGNASLSVLELFLWESDQGTLIGTLTLSYFLLQEMLCPKGTSSISLCNECMWQVGASSPGSSSGHTCRQWLAAVSCSSTPLSDTHHVNYIRLGFCGSRCRHCGL